ncbi:hypothetical protein Trydic_g2175 [Trypoxylus dichotomus]
MDSYEHKSKVWLRYVDDTFVIWPHGEEEVNGFLHHLNGLEESIKFTMELEVNNRIPFLEALVHKQSEGTLRTTLYKKPTHTGQYLHFESNHPHNVKRQTMSLNVCIIGPQRYVRIIEIEKRNSAPSQIH